MLQIAQNFQQVVAGLSNNWLIGLGLAATIAGLFIWLGGLGLRRILVAVAGAIAGGGCAYLIVGPDIMPVAISAAAAILIAIVLEKVFIAILAGALAAFFGLAVLAEFFDVGLGQGPKQAFLEMSLSGRVSVGALAVVFMLAGLYMTRFISALCCAALGTLLVFSGMIMLLLFKGAEPVTTIRAWPNFYSAVFLVMVASGTTAQLLLCPPPREKGMKKKQPDKDKDQPEQTQSWRTR